MILDQNEQSPQGRFSLTLEAQKPGKSAPGGEVAKYADPFSDAMAQKPYPLGGTYLYSDIGEYPLPRKNNPEALVISKRLIFPLR